MPEKHFSHQSLTLRAVALLVVLAVYHLTTEALDFEENWPAQWFLTAVAVASLLAFAMRSAKVLRAS
jgi:hypothetical protein